MAKDMNVRWPKPLAIKSPVKKGDYPGAPIKGGKTGGTKSV